MKKKGRRSRKRLLHRGSITVYLTLTLTVLLLVLTSLMDSVRGAADRVQILCAMDIGLYSLFGKYSREAYEKYGLLFLDAGEDLESGLGEMYREALAWMEPVLEENRRELRITGGGIIGFRLLTENQFQPLIHEIMTAESFLPRTSVPRSAVSAQRWQDWMEAGRQREEEPAFREWLQIQGSPLPEEQMEMLLSSLMLPEEGDVLRLPGVSRSSAEGLLVADSMGYLPMEREKLENYLFHVLGDFREPADGTLHYQVEYLVGGKNTDRENLREVLQRIRWIREGIRLEDRGSDASEDTYDPVIAAGAEEEIPEDGESERHIEFLRTYLESWEDTLALLQGETVDAMRYEDYLKLFLDEETELHVLYGLMDCIEDSMQESEPGFQLEHCITAMELSVSVCDSGTGDWTVQRSYGYD